VSTFKKEYDVQASAVITNALVMVADELKEGAEFPPCVYTESAAWDTGAEITIISPRLVETLGLVPHNKGEFMAHHQQGRKDNVPVPYTQRRRR